MHSWTRLGAGPGVYEDMMTLGEVQGENAPGLAQVLFPGLERDPGWWGEFRQPPPPHSLTFSFNAAIA